MQFSLKRLLVLVALIAIIAARAPEALPTITVATASGLSAMGLLLLAAKCGRYDKCERPLPAFGKRLFAIPCLVVGFFLAVFSVAGWLKAIAIAMHQASP